MNTLKLTREHFDSDGWYVGDVDISSQPFDGHIEIAANLGTCRFKNRVWARGFIRALAGSGIEAGLGIKAGYGIEAGYGIVAGGNIEAGWGIESGGSIVAGGGIVAGWGIVAGEDIVAGEGIVSSWGIKAKTELKVGFRIFAGISRRTKTPTADQLKIECGALVSGEVCYGNLVETGMPVDSVPEIVGGKEE